MGGQRLSMMAAIMDSGAVTVRKKCEVSFGRLLWSLSVRTWFNLQRTINLYQISIGIAEMGGADTPIRVIRHGGDEGDVVCL